MNDRSDIAERAVAAYNKHDGAGFAESFSEDGVLAFATGESAEGREQIAATMEDAWRAFPDWTLDPRGWYHCEGAVFLPWTISGTHEGEFRGIPPTHQRFEMRGCSHFTLAGDGAIARDDVYFDSTTMMQQLGLMPEPEATQAD